MMEFGAQVQVRHPQAPWPKEEAVTCFLLRRVERGQAWRVKLHRTLVASCGQSPQPTFPPSLLSGKHVRSEVGVNRALFEIKSL